MQSFSFEQATAIYHTALNRSLNVNLHEQTLDERAAWEREFSSKVMDGILEGANDPAILEELLEQVRAL